ncbi:MAG: glycosyltransferase family 39 protein [Clostridia bacterium]|nr:glycosyltransferase family 39 protein [Clostridia bacterium]
MESTLSKKQKWQKDLETTWLPCLLMALVCFLSAFLNDKSTDDIAKVGLCFFCGFLFVVVYLYLNKMLSWQTAITLIFIAGVFVRLCYIFYTGYRVRQHDVWSVDSGKGHMAYIQYIATNLAIPDTNETWQFYHPPLHHILAGLLYRFLSHGSLQPEQIAEKLQFLTMFYSCLTMITCDRLFAALKLKDSTRFLADCVIAFHPTFFQVGGDLNNDMLASFLAILSILYLVKWWNEQKTKQLAFCGLFLGLSMMAKISGAILAFPYAFLFLYRLVKNIKTPKRLIKQYLLFGIISIPIGMWYPIRNLLRFHQNILYVPDFGPNSGQYIGDISPFHRLFAIPSGQLAFPYQCWANGDEPGLGSNIFLSAFKTSVFGEHSLGAGPWAYILLYSFIFLAVVSFFYMLWNAFDKKNFKENPTHALWTILIGSLLISFISFCLKYTSVCSQDFRYLTITLPVVALYFALAIEKAKPRWLQPCFLCLLVAFCLSSYMTYAVPAIWGL